MARLPRLLLCMSVIAGLSACQTTAGAEVPAKISPYDSAAVQTLKNLLAKALGRATIDLGPADPGRATVITVLPAPLGPYETNSVAKPIRFEIVLRGESCYAVRSDTDEAYELKNLKCVPVTPM